jgi:hypothetical protein
MNVFLGDRMQSIIFGMHAGAFQQEKELYDDPSQPLGRMLPQLHSIREGSEHGLRDAYRSLLPPCIVMEKGEPLDVWIRSSGERIDIVAGLQVRAAPTPARRAGAL